MNTAEFKALTEKQSYIKAGSEAHLFMRAAAEEARKITFEINAGFHTNEELRVLFSRLIGTEVDENFVLFPPFYTDFGKNISLGADVFINSGCTFQDQGGIFIGDGALIGHQVVLATLNHEQNPARRKNIIPAPISIGKNVWIGAHATVLPGVTIGDNAIIAAGATVNKSLPANAVAAGSPAKIVKFIEKGEIYE